MMCMYYERVITKFENLKVNVNGFHHAELHTTTTTTSSAATRSSTLLFIIKR
jgi:hypothetical protein